MALPQSWSALNSVAPITTKGRADAQSVPSPAAMGYTTAMVTSGQGRCWGPCLGPGPTATRICVDVHCPCCHQGLQVCPVLGHHLRQCWSLGSSLLLKLVLSPYGSERPALPPGTVVPSCPRLLLLIMSGSKILLQLRSVLPVLPQSLM